MSPTQVSRIDENRNHDEASKENCLQTRLIQTMTTDSTILCGPRLIWSPNFQADFRPIFSADERNTGF